jgi:uncharacterized protein YuzE
MRINYHPETDSLYIDFSDAPGVESEEVRDGVVIDLDRDGNITGLDIQHASQKLDLSMLETTAFPSNRFKMAG